MKDNIIQVHQFRLSSMEIMKFRSRVEQIQL